MMRISLAIAILVLANFSSAMADDIKPEMIVKFTKGGIACLDRDNLQEITEHAIKGEKTKTEAMMIQNGGDCVMLSPSKRFKVLSAEYNNPDLDFGLLEIVGADKVSLHGAWAFSIGAEEDAPPNRVRKKAVQ
jgi:hypothetical protein